MAESIIQQVTNNSSSNYCKMPDGTLIQWGRRTLTSATAGSYGGIYIQGLNLSFHIPFIDTNYVVTGSAKFGTGAELPFGCAGGGTESYAFIRLWDVTSRTATSSAYWVINWIAVGRWK